MLVCMRVLELFSVTVLKTRVQAIKVDTTVMDRSISLALQHFDCLSAVLKAEQRACIKSVSFFGYLPALINYHSSATIHVLPFVLSDKHDRQSLLHCCLTK